MVRTRNKHGRFLFGLFGNTKKSSSHHAAKARHKFGPGVALEAGLDDFDIHKPRKHKSRKHKSRKHKSKKGGGFMNFFKPDEYDANTPLGRAVKEAKTEAKNTASGAWLTNCVNAGTSQVMCTNKQIQQHMFDTDRAEKLEAEAKREQKELYKGNLQEYQVQQKKECQNYPSRKTDTEWIRPWCNVIAPPRATVRPASRGTQEDALPRHAGPEVRKRRDEEDYSSHGGRKRKSRKQRKRTKKGMFRKTARVVALAAAAAATAIYMKRRKSRKTRRGGANCNSQLGSKCPYHKKNGHHKY